MIRAVLFDLDGTLIDSIDSMAEAGNQMLEQFGLMPQPRDSYRYFAGDGAKTLVFRALQAAGSAHPKLLAEDALKLYMDLFSISCTHNIAPYEGILSLLQALSARGIQIAVLSNKPHQQAHDALGASLACIHFDAIQGQTADIPPKPDQKGLCSILRKLGRTPDECLYVGDTGVDMQTGNLAGIRTVGVLWGFREEEELRHANADYIISQPHELLALID